MLSRVARANAARVQELAILVVAELQRADRLGLGGGWDVADNHKFLAQDALRFEPMIAAARAVGQIGALGDNTLEAKAAGMLEHHGPVLREVFAKAQRQTASSLCDNLLQQSLAVDQRHLGEVEAFAIE